MAPYLIYRHAEYRTLRLQRAIDFIQNHQRFAILLGDVLVVAHHFNTIDEVVRGPLIGGINLSIMSEICTSMHS